MNTQHQYPWIRWAVRGASLAAIGVGLVAGLPSATATTGGPGDPVPTFELASAHKTVFVNMDFTNQNQVTVNSGGVALGRPPVRTGNPPLLEVVLKDKNGVVVERYNAWHPLWQFVEEGPGGEGLRILPSAMGTFPYAFNPAVRTMDVTDIPQNQLLITADVVAAAVRPFCQANSTDPDCRTDVGLSKADAPDPVAAGAVLTYTLAVTNHGTNPAYATRLVDTLPAGVTFQTATPTCVEAPLRTLTCDVGVLDPGETRQVVISVLVDADLVYRSGGPLNISNTGVASNPAGADANLANNTASASTRVTAVADLAVDSFAAVGTPPQIVLGKPATLTVRTVASNAGPSSPMDATLGSAAAATAGATISPTTRQVLVPALAVGAPRTIDDTYTLGCSQPGNHTFTLSTSVRPTNAADSDPNLANNARNLALTIDCVVPVAINVSPGETPNSIQVSSEGVITVAVLTTRAGEYGLPLAFDAPRILPLTVRFGQPAVFAANSGGASEVHNEGHLEDSFELVGGGARERTRDGDLDMLLHFATPSTGLTLSDREACAKGSFTASNGNVYRFFGCDAIRPVP